MADGGDGRDDSVGTDARYHFGDVMTGAIASQITSLTIVYSTVYSDADQRKHQSSASLAFVWGIYGGPVNSPHKGPVTRKMFSFDDVFVMKSPTVNRGDLITINTYDYVFSNLHNCDRIHDDVIKWKHIPRYWPFVRGIHRSRLNSSHKGQ